MCYFNNLFPIRILNSKGFIKSLYSKKAYHVLILQGNTFFCGTFSILGNRDTKKKAL